MRIARIVVWVVVAATPGSIVHARLTSTGSEILPVVRPGQMTPDVRVIIRVDDLAGTPDRDLDAAKSEMTRIFRAAGVDVTWADPAAMPPTGELTLVLVKHKAQPPSERGDVAGEAIRVASRAYVYCDRLDVVTRHLPIDANVILGRVMAHEVGHLLLPTNSHSRVGIMRPHVEFSQVGVNTFSSDQAQALHKAVWRQ